MEPSYSFLSRGLIEMDIEQEIIFNKENVPVSDEWQYDERALEYDCTILGGFIKFAPNCQNKLLVCPKVGGTPTASTPIPEFGKDSKQWLIGDGDFVTFSSFRKAKQGEKIIMAYRNIDGDGDTRTLYAHIRVLKSEIAKLEKLTFTEWLELFPKVIRAWLS